MEVQIFGVHKSADTRKALRFFCERRARVHFVDLREHAVSKGELHRFAQKFGVSALIEKESRRYRHLGLGTARYDDGWWLAKLAQEPLVLRMPLVRWQEKLTIGLAEQEWRGWAVTAGGATP